MEVVFSVIVPCYNMQDYLPESLNSVIAQTYEKWECIVVDDGSTDNSIEIANQYAKKDSRIRVISQSNRGVAAARNNGVRQSTGKYLLPLDADDIIAPQYLEKAYNRFVEFPHTTLVYCQARFFGEKEEHWDLPHYTFEQLLINNIIFNAAVFKREDFDKTNGYPENVSFEDWDFWLTLLSEHSCVYQIPEELFFYRQRISSRNAQACEEIQEQKRMLYYRHAQLYDKYFPNFSYYRYWGYDCQAVLNQVPNFSRQQITHYQTHIFLSANQYSWKHAIINKIARFLGLGIPYINYEWENQK